MDIRQPRLGIPSRGYCFFESRGATLWIGAVTERSSGISLKKKQQAEHLYEPYY